MTTPATRVNLVQASVDLSHQYFQHFRGDQQLLASPVFVITHFDHAIGLLQGMFNKNILTVNPGWNSDAAATQRIHGRSRVAAPAQSELEHLGVNMIPQADESSTGLASLRIGELKSVCLNRNLPGSYLVA